MKNPGPNPIDACRRFWRGGPGGARVRDNNRRRSLMRRLYWTLSLFLTVGFFAPPAAAQNPKLVMEEFMVPAKHPDLQLYVRNKRPEGMTQFSPEKTVVYVHGATYPSETAFDLPLAGQSWMDHIASRGYDVYLLDLRGYGKSSRPKEMDQPPEANEPIVTTEVAPGGGAAGGGANPPH